MRLTVRIPLLLFSIAAIGVLVWFAMSQPAAQAQTTDPGCPASTSTSTEPGPTPIPDLNATSSCDQAPVGGASGASGSTPDTVTGTLVDGTTIFFGTTTPSRIGPRGASSLAVPGQELYCTPDGNGGYECPYATSTSSTSTSGASGTAGGAPVGLLLTRGQTDLLVRLTTWIVTTTRAKGQIEQAPPRYG